MSKLNYKLTKNIKIHLGVVLYQIQAIEDFRDIKKGDLGGWIEKTDNLSGNAWVFSSAKVYGNAKVFGDAEVYGSARVFGDAWVYGSAWVYGNVKAETGYWYAHQRSDWDITKVKMPDGYETLVRDYKPPKSEEDDVDITVEGQTKTISRKSAIALGLLED